jgi:putative membrane protein
LLTGLAALVWSGLRPNDRPTWLLEVAPIFIALPILLASYRSFPLTLLSYCLILAHALILMLGGHYTYAQVPLGFWVQDLFDLGRNHYDRLGHFGQGFVPAIIAREILLRKSPLQPGRMLFFLVVCVCLAISASYELLEWATALILGQGAEAFLGTQGDPWDTQADMFLALIGAIAAQLLLGRIHTQQIAAIKNQQADRPLANIT